MFALPKAGFLMDNPFLTDGLPCAICRKPVPLEASKTNELGQALHSDCALESTCRYDNGDEYES